MLSDRDALLAAIRANPDEDTPRLMFADWLDESGDANRAEFVRLQCELAAAEDECSGSFAMYEFLRDRYALGLAATDWTRIDLGVHRLVAAAMRADDLRVRHGEAWVPQVPKKHKVQWAGFRRGFAHRVTLDGARALSAVAGRLRAAVPAVTLVTSELASRVERLADAGLLDWLGGLEVNHAVAADLSEFGHRPETASVRALALRYATTDLAAALGAPHWTGLRDLDLSAAPMPFLEAETLFRTPHLRTLNRLRFHGGDDWTADTVRVFAAAGFTSLRSVRLAHCGLDDDAAESLANCPHLADLRVLDLAHNRITGRGATALLCSPHLANVAYLGLDGNPCRGVDAARLAAAPPAGLRLLNCHGCRFRTADVRALVRSPRLRTLWYLDFDDNNLGTPAVRELVRAFKDWCPPLLWLIRNRIDDRGAGVLANWKGKGATGLRALHVKYNDRITDAGVSTLLDSPHLAHLDALGVSSASDETEARRRARFKHTDGY